MMDGYSEITYLTSGLQISELRDDGYYEIVDQNGADIVYMSEAAVKDILERFREDQ